MNYAVDDVLKLAREDCLVPWLSEMQSSEGELEPAEIVMDVVLYDGQMADITFRSLTYDVPRDVVDCVAERAWSAEWPSWDLSGELRLQRSASVRPP